MVTITSSRTEIVAGRQELIDQAKSLAATITRQVHRTPSSPLLLDSIEVLDDGDFETRAGALRDAAQELFEGLDNRSIRPNDERRTDQIRQLVRRIRASLDEEERLATLLKRVDNDIREIEVICEILVPNFSFARYYLWTYGGRHFVTRMTMSAVNGDYADVVVYHSNERGRKRKHMGGFSMCPTDLDAQKDLIRRAIASESPPLS